MEKTPAAVCGFYGYGNYGDSLMKEWLNFFLTRKCNLDVDFFSDKQSNEALSWKDQSVLAYPIIILGGGGIITENFWFFKNKLDSDITDQKLCIINVNLTKESVSPLKRVKDKLKLIVVRDTVSLSIATSVLDNKKTTILYAGDITLINKFDKVYISKAVTFCPNAYILKDFFSSDCRKRIYAEKFIIEISSFLKWIKTFGDRVFLAPSQNSKEINDNIFCGIVDGYINGSDYWCLTSGRNIEHCMRDSSLILSMRYHTTIFAAKYGIPFIDISHHSKNLNFLKDNDLLDHSISYWSCSLDSLIAGAKKAEQSKKIKDFASNYSVSFNEEWKQVEQCLKQMI